MRDLNDMWYFAEVVDKGGFAAASRSLGLPKSRLSRRVAELETRLGVRLLHRTTRKLSLTAVGEMFLRHCVAMREEALAAEQAVDQSHTQPRGTIRVACPVTLAQTKVGEILPQFLLRFPQVTVDMQVSNRVVDLVEEGFDVALRVRDRLDSSGSMVVKNLGHSTALLVASPAYLTRFGTPESPADLAGHQGVLVHTGQHYDATMSDSFFHDLGLPQPDHHLGIGSGASTVSIFPTPIHVFTKTYVNFIVNINI